MSTRTEFAGVGRLPEGLIYPELVHTGLVETLAQNSNAFNAASNGAIQLITQAFRGDFLQESFFNQVGLISRRVNSGVSPVNPTLGEPTAVTGREKITVKLNRRIGPVDWTRDVANLMGMSQEVFSLAMGEMAAKEIQIDWLHTALVALAAATVNEAEQTVIASPLPDIDTPLLTRGLQVYGDALGSVKLWVMHSAVYFALVREQIGANITNIADFNVREGTPVTLGIPVLVTDDAALVAPVSPDLPETRQYTTLGIVEGGVSILEQGEPFVHTEIQQGRENLVVAMQGEHGFGLGLKGYSWDVGNGGQNPDDTALGTGSNFDSVATDSKNLAAAAIVHQVPAL